MNDLATYCPERRPADKFDIPGSYFIMSEVAEVASAMLDAKMISMFRKYPDAIDTIHFSDQFTGPKPGEDQQPLELPQGKQVLIFVFNIMTGKDKTLEDAIEDTKPLMQLVFYCLDKVKRYKLSREAKNKADKNRTRVTENHWRSIHAVKAEKAAEDARRNEERSRKESGKLKTPRSRGRWRSVRTEGRRRSSSLRLTEVDKRLFEIII